MDDWGVWLVLAGLLALAETLTLDLTAAMLATGALGGAAAAALGAPFLVSVVVAALVTGVLLGAVRPVARRHLQVRGLPNDPGAALVGREAVVVREVTDSSGQVRVHGELWTARPALPGTVVPSGATVWVGAVTGATVTVHALPTTSLPPGQETP